MELTPHDSDNGFILGNRRAPTSRVYHLQADSTATKRPPPQRLRDENLINACITSNVYYSELHKFNNENNMRNRNG